MYYRELILKTALGIYVQEGLEKVTISNIAYKACIAKKTVYKYFSNKQQIALAATAAYFNTHQDIHLSIENNTGHPVEAMLAMLAHDIVVFQTVDATQLPAIQKHHIKCLKYYHK